MDPTPDIAEALLGMLFLTGAAAAFCIGVSYLVAAVLGWKDPPG